MNLKPFVRRQWKEWRRTLLFVLFVFIPIRSSIADWNIVPTGSMNPTILEGDVVFVDKTAYDLRVPLTFQRITTWGHPERGDIVVCFSPVDGTRLVKRVVAIPGDRIAMANGGLVLNGTPVGYDAPHPHFQEALASPRFNRARNATENLPEHSHAVMAFPVSGSPRNLAETTLSPDQYFMMGDNRDNSLDSRTYGSIDRSKIIGRVRRTLVSFDKFDGWKPRWGRFGRRLDP